MKYLLAILACAGIFLLYCFIGSAVFGWKGSGGAIPTLILFASVGATWRAITNKSDSGDGE
jgi:hypothetical protein